MTTKLVEIMEHTKTRRRVAWEYRLQGWTYKSIGEALGGRSKTRAAQWLARESRERGIPVPKRSQKCQNT